MGAASPGDLMAARVQMGLSLGWHIVLACLGVGMPLLLLFVNWRGVRRGDADYRLLALRWARAVGVLFAVGAISGTILSFEMGLLWPGLMGVYGQVIGFPFALEGVAFFIEAIFIGIYLYGRDRLPPRLHLLSGVPIAVAGVASAFFVVSANAWLNTPAGFEQAGGRVTSVRPWAAMMNPGTWPQAIHMILAALMVTGFLVASVYAVAILRGRRDRYHRLGFVVPFTFGAVLAPVQIYVGDWMARFIGTEQPAKLAAAEGLFRTQSSAPLAVGGVVSGDELHYAFEIPGLLSFLVGGSPRTVVRGLDQVPPADRAPVMITHYSFDIMVALGFLLFLLGLWFGFLWWRHHDLPANPWFFRAAALSGLGAVVALETGWLVTELGRQPWTVYGHLRTADAVNPAAGLRVTLAVVIVVYAVLTVALVYVLRLLARDGARAPQEPARGEP
jgi:cytochrome d ubiquinol oxidase subunit I